jgi:hypothetical protein
LPQRVTLVVCNLKLPGFYYGWDDEEYNIAWKLCRCANKFRMFEAERQTATKNVVSFVRIFCTCIEIHF